MKNSHLFLIGLILIPYSLFAQELESQASYIKDNYPDDYQTTIRKHALEEWGNDFSMVVYEINKQSEALFELVNAFESDNTNIAFRAIQEWSIDGYLSSNIEKFKKIKTFSVENLIKLHCDWSMVKYEYDKQVKAKNAF